MTSYLCLCRSHKWRCGTHSIWQSGAWCMALASTHRLLGWWATISFDDVINLSFVFKLVDGIASVWCLLYNASGGLLVHCQMGKRDLAFICHICWGTVATRTKSVGHWCISGNSQQTEFNLIGIFCIGIIHSTSTWNRSGVCSVLFMKKAAFRVC